MSYELLAQRRREALALVKKGGLSTKIGLAFLNQHGAD